MLSEAEVRKLREEYLGDVRHAVADIDRYQTEGNDFMLAMTERVKEGYERIVAVIETCLAQWKRADVAEEALAECHCWDPELVERNNPLGSPLKDCGKCAVCLAKLVVAKRKEQEAEARGDTQVHAVLDEMAKRKERSDENT